MIATRSSDGMTLIELLIAMAIFAVMTAGIMITFDSFNRGKEVTEKNAKRLKEYQIAFNIIGRDVLQIIPRPVTDEFGSELPLYSMRSEDGSAVEFSRAGWNRSPFSKVKRSEIQRVSYYLEEGKVMRAYWKVLDRAEDTVPVRAELLDGVDSLAFSFMYLDQNNAWQTSEVWPPQKLMTGESGEQRTTVPAREFLLLPRVFEIRLNTADLGDISRKFAIANCLVDVLHPQEGQADPNDPTAGGGCGP